MKRKWMIMSLAIMVIVCVVALSACDANGTALVGDKVNGNGNGNTTSNDDNSTSTVSGKNMAAAVDTAFEEVDEATGDFVIVATDGGVYSRSGNVYTLTAAGTYTLSGSLEGQIVVDAADAEVEIALDGVTITYGQDSPIKAVAADKVEISAKKDSDNVIKDTRSAKTTDVESQGEGAIYAKCDLKLKGSGVLVVTANYNNGVHTTKDLTIQNLSLKVTAVNNAIKGNDSVTVRSGTAAVISTKGDAIKTQNTDLSAKGVQRGSVTIEDGAVSVYAAGDGIQAAYDFVMQGGSLSVYTGSYSSYTASGATTTSYKGVKVGNELTVNDGTLYICSYDDGLHADYGTVLDNKAKGKGNITVNGGNIEVSVYSPAKSTAMGGWGPRGGWSNQQSVKGSDALHADNTLSVNGGSILVDSAYEGLEANYVVITGGDIRISANDDGVNAFKKIGTPSITVSGGYLFVSVPTNGDTDGIDSNGTYVQTGGVVITCGPGSASGGLGGGAWALDTDGGVTLKGGTLVVFGGIESTPSASNMTKTLCSTSTVSAGSHTVSVGSANYTVILPNACSGCLVYSDQGNATLK